MRRYTVLLIPDLVDGGYTVTMPTLPGCVTEGDTLSEALDHAGDAIRLFIADLEAEGKRRQRRRFRWLWQPSGPDTH